MHIIIIGGEPVGEHLVDQALRHGHSVTLVEEDAERAERCAQAYDAQVLHASIDAEGILDEADAADAGALIATTGDDSVNLMAMILGQHYEIPNLVSAVNSRHRKMLFDRLGVNTLVDPEVLAARYLLHLAIFPGMENVTPLAGDGYVYELQVGDASVLVGRQVADLADDKVLPGGVFIVLVKRGGKRLYPRPDLALAAADRLLVYSADPLAQRELDVFTGQAS